MDQPEVTGFALPGLTLMGVDELQVKQCIIMPRMIILGPGREFLVGRHERTRYIVGEEVRLCVHVQKLDNIFVTHNPSATSLGERFSGNNLPVVVGVVMAVTSNLLAWDFAGLVDRKVNTEN
jgi:hypothetical protein